MFFFFFVCVCVYLYALRKRSILFSVLFFFCTSLRGFKTERTSDKKANALLHFSPSIFFFQKLPRKQFFFFPSALLHTLT